jgi:hypothetical protein
MSTQNSKQLVMLVAIASATAFGVEVQNLDKTVRKTMLVEAITEQPTPEAIRAKLEACVTKLGENFIVVAPSKHKIAGTVNAKAAGLDQNALHGYESFQARADWNPEVKKAAKPQLTIEQVAALKTVTTGQILTRNGKTTKAEVARSIIKAGIESGSGVEAMVQSIAAKCEFGMQLARVYFRENLKKVLPREEPAAEAGAADTTQASQAADPTAEGNVDTGSTQEGELVAA